MLHFAFFANILTCLYIIVFLLNQLRTVLMGKSVLQISIDANSKILKMSLLDMKYILSFNMILCNIPKFAECFYIFYIINANTFFPDEFRPLYILSIYSNLC